MIQEQVPESAFSPDTPDGKGTSACIAIIGIECFLAQREFDESSLARYLFDNTNDVDDLEAQCMRPLKLSDCYSVRKMREWFLPGKHMVLVCADRESEAEEAASFLASLFSANDTIPEVKRFGGSDCMFDALATAAAQSGSYDTVRILCVETNSDWVSPESACVSFISISVSSITSVEAISEVIAIVTPVEGEYSCRISNDTKGRAADLDLRDRGYPWSAVSLVVTSADSSDSILEAQAEEFRSTCQLSEEDAYNKLTGMPCSNGAPKTLLSTRALAARTGITSNAFQDLLALSCASLSAYQKILPKSDDSVKNAPTLNGLVQELAARPWIHPVSPVEPLQPRRALLLDNHGRKFGVEEATQGVDNDFQSYLRIRDSEIFLFAADDSMTLISRMTACRDALESGYEGDLASLAAQINLSVQISNHQTDRAGIIASSIPDLVQKLEEAIDSLSNDLSNPHCDERAANTREAQRRARGIYITHAAFSPDRETGNSIAFILPGLGAAYPDMLLDLCFHFPQVRQVFDFVDRLALKAGDHVAPSRLIFPSRSSQGSNTALLAMMDSAVVTVILAEWAFYRMLRDFNISPDTILGCSTGEFASLAMNGCVDIVEAAGTFYRLSTEVARSVPLSSLANLRSICAAAEWRRIEPLAGKTSQTVYLSAEMGPCYSIVSGPRTAIDELSKELDRERIDFYPLPVAIPYHTPLVSGKVSTEQSEVRQLEMRSPELPTWTCSDSGLLPNDPEQLRQWSVGLFEKPIQFRATIQRMYDAGARIFVEVGPKGSLVPLVSDCLSGREHLAVPVNVANRSGITQIHHMLATLFCAGVNIDPSPLYSNRRLSKCNLELPAPIMQFAPDYHFDSAIELEDDWQPAAVPDEQFVQDEGTATDAVLASFLNTLQEFHTRMLLTQELVITEYLQNSAPSLEEDETDEQVEEFESVFGFAFVNEADFDVRTSCFNFVLDPAQHLFLLDHAIGGNTRSHIPERVYLVPLMVTLEILAEAACIFLPGRVVSSIRNVRAYKRVKVDSAALNLQVRIRSCDEETGVVVAELVSPDGQIYVQAEVWIAAQFNVDVPLIIPVKDVGASMFVGDRLYGRGSMFHGPSMQSVESLRTGTKYQDGLIRSNDYQSWFAAYAPSILAIDPLLLDNASQLVLYHMYEAGIEATALLPFHIDSIDFYDDLVAHRGTLLQGRTKLQSVSNRGTVADIEILTAEGTLLCRVSSINSRAILLPSTLQEFIASPAEHYLARFMYDFEDSVTPAQFLPPVADASRGKPALTANRVVAQSSLEDLSIDQTALHWLSDYIFNADDLQYAPPQRAGLERRYREWILGRLAVKDAVRLWLLSNYNLQICPADISIVCTETGAPVVVIPGLPESIPLPSVSISHKDDFAVAVASLSDSPVGVDVENVMARDAGFEKIAFTPSEITILDAMPLDRATVQTLLWTVKEAAAKAGGEGLQKVDHIQVTEVDVEGQQARVFDTRADRSRIVYFRQSGNFVIALSY